MNFQLSADQVALRDAVRELLAKSCTPEQLRSAWDSATGRVPGLWDKLVEFGLCDLLVPNGLGLGLVELALVMEEIGRAAVPEPLLGTIVAQFLHPRDASSERAVALEPWSLVPYAPQVERFVVQRGGELFDVAAADAAVVEELTVDRGMRMGRLSADLPNALPLAVAHIDVVRDQLVLGAAAELVGLASAMLDMSVAYAKERVQFGVPIGSFQAVKHQLADVYVAVEFARPVVWRAAWTGESADVSHGKIAATHAAALAARAALQVHGAIGYTFEHDLHMWLKRTWSLTPLWGEEGTHRARVARGVLFTG